MMNRISKIFVTISVVALLAIAMAPQASAASPYEQQELQMRYDMTEAHANFMTGVLADTVSLVPQASDLNAHISTLNADLAQLQAYVSASDRASFNSYQANSLHPHIGDAGAALRNDKQQFRSWNVTNATKLQLYHMYEARKATYESEINQAKVAMGQIRLTYYNDQIVKAESKMTNMAARGVDVSEMQSLTASARANVIDPLQAAVNTNDGNTVMNEIKAKTLYNGAPYSFHYGARMDLAALKAVTAYITPNATAAGYGDEIAEINAKLASAESGLNAVGTNPYTDAQMEQIFGDLRAASGLLKTIINGLNSGGQS